MRLTFVSSRRTRNTVDWCWQPVRGTYSALPIVNKHTNYSEVNIENGNKGRLFLGYELVVSALCRIAKS